MSNIITCKLCINEVDKNGYKHKADHFCGTERIGGKEQVISHNWVENHAYILPHNIGFKPLFL